jgi:AcrR family transcriptional regulator
MSDSSLRERSRARRRRAIQLAAMRLFAEQGYDATTVAQIAAAADVAPRTVSLHFPTKVDIALASSDAAAERLTRLLEQRAPEISVTEAFMRWLGAEPAFVHEHEWRLRSAMFRANPALTAVGTAQTALLMHAIGAALALELDVAIDDVAVEVAIGAFAGVVLRYELLPETVRDDSVVLATVRAALTGAIDGVRRELRSR